MLKETKQFTFYGHVQGVGFRYTCRRLAQKFALTGWVKNELDGTVTVVVQGPAKKIQRFLLGLTRQSYLAGLIADFDEETVAKASYPDFRVVY
ncbi:MAG: acylphosphatase [Lactobacillus sp.]